MYSAHAVTWCARLVPLIWLAFRKESSMPDDATFASTKDSIQPLSFSRSPITQRNAISIYKPPNWMTNFCSPCFSGQVHWICSVCGSNSPCSWQNCSLKKNAIHLYQTSFQPTLQNDSYIMTNLHVSIWMKQINRSAGSSTTQKV